MKSKKLYTLKQNGMKLVESLYNDETLMVLCPDTDELCILKKTPLKDIYLFGLKYKRNTYLVEYTFSAGNVLFELENSIE